MVIRYAEPGDISTVTSIHVLTWRDTYASLLPKPALESVTDESANALWERVFALRTNPPLWEGERSAGRQEPAASGAAIWVVEGDEGLSSFLSSWYRADPNPSVEIMALYVLPVLQKGGYGRALVTACRDYASDIGAQAIDAWALAGNEKANGFYQHVGFEAIGTRQMEVQGHWIEEYGYRLLL